VIKFKRNKLLSAYTSYRIDDVRRASLFANLRYLKIR